jgi:hypothetical protein
VKSFSYEIAQVELSPSGWDRVFHGIKARPQNIWLYAKVEADLIFVK